MTTTTASATRYAAIGTGRSVHLAYYVGDKLTGTHCDRAAWETKRVREIDAEAATCSRCLKVAASETSVPNTERELLPANPATEALRRNVSGRVEAGTAEPIVAVEEVREEARVEVCTAGHYDGSRPQIVPVAGNNDREIPLFLVYHGDKHLDETGTVVRFPCRMTYAAAVDAIALHEAGLELPLAERRILEDLTVRGIDPRAVAKRRAPMHLARLQRRGLLTLDGDGVPDLVDEVAALVWLGRACGQHDRPLPCLECQ